MSVHPARPTEQIASSRYDINNLSDVVKFTALASSLAIFIDAAIAHAMLWGNDPYWTYWVTDTLLMATVFGISTMLFGIGIGRGALITAVHVLLLTTYYWSLSPIGLPSHPEWLDLERTWITGLPVHLSVYYMGYLGAMWLWGRRRSIRAHDDAPAPPSLARYGAVALLASVLIVVVSGLIQTLLLDDFPGLTWFIMRIAVATPFAIAWWALAGHDRVSAIAGGVVLAFLLITYSHYLGPVGLPTDPARLLAGDAPPAEVHWLSYREEYMAMLPLTAVVASMVCLLSARLLGGGGGPRVSRAAVLGGLVAAAGLTILAFATAPDLGSEANQLTVRSVGSASVAADGERGSAGSADLQMVVANRNTHRTPLPPHDSINLLATITSNGQAYEIRANQAMIADPEARFTTWYGVGFGEWHEGRSGIGLLHRPARKSDVVAFALGEVRSNGQPIATGVPLQISASSDGTPKLEIVVGNLAEDRGPLRVSWAEFEASDSDRSKNARYVFGGGVLLLFLIILFMAASRQHKRLTNGSEEPSRQRASGTDRILHGH